MTFIAGTLSAEGRRSFILMSKVLQNLANGTEFSETKTPLLIPMNEFIRANSLPLETYLDLLTVRVGLFGVLLGFYSVFCGLFFLHPM